MKLKTRTANPRQPRRAPVSCSAHIGDRVYVEAMHGRGGGYFGVLAGMTRHRATVVTKAGTIQWGRMWTRAVRTTCLPCQVRVCSPNAPHELPPIKTP